MKRLFCLLTACILLGCATALAQSVNGYSPAELSALIEAYRNPTGAHYGEPLPDWLSAYLHGAAADKGAAQGGALTVQPYAQGDAEIKGTGAPGATVRVEWPDKSARVTQVGANGAWFVPAADGLRQGESIRVTQAETGDAAGESAVVDVLQGRQVQSALLRVAPMAKGDASIYGFGSPGALIAVTWPDESDAFIQIPEDGAWSLPAPGWLAVGHVIEVTQTEPGKSASQPVCVTVAWAVSKMPVVHPATGGDTALRGAMGVPGAAIRVVWANGAASSATVEADGAWSVLAPNPLSSGQVITAAQAEPGKAESMSAVLTVR